MYIFTNQKQSIVNFGSVEKFTDSVGLPKFLYFFLFLKPFSGAIDSPVLELW